MPFLIDNLDGGGVREEHSEQANDRTLSRQGE